MSPLVGIDKDAAVIAGNRSAKYLWLSSDRRHGGILLNVMGLIDVGASLN
jgi:hypothetical protein